MIYAPETERVFPIGAQCQLRRSNHASGGLWLLINSFRYFTVRLGGLRYDISKLLDIAPSEEEDARAARFLVARFSKKSTVDEKATKPRQGAIPLEGQGVTPDRWCIRRR